MIEVQVPPRATEAALRPFLDVLRGKYEAGAVYVVQGELRPDGVLILRATVLPSTAPKSAAE